MADLLQLIRAYSRCVEGNVSTADGERSRNESLVWWAQGGSVCMREGKGVRGVIQWGLEILGGKWAEREAAVELCAFRGSVEAQRGSFVPSATRLDLLQKETHRQHSILFFVIPHHLPF